MKKLLIGLAAIALLAGGVFLAVVLFEPQFPEAVSLFPKDTMFYSGTRSPVKIAAALAVTDIEQTLQDEAGLTEEESRVVSEWIRHLRGVHVGFHSFTLVPFVVDAAVVLEGSFDRPLTDILGQRLSRKIVVDESYRDVAVNKMRIPIGPKFSFEIYMADPVEDYLFVAFSRRTMKALVDQMLDGGPSLADNSQFIEMASFPGIRSADTLQYVDTQAYLNLIRDWTKTIPYPPVQPLVDLIWSELRLADYQQFVTGFHFESQEGHSFQRINPENPVYKQLLAGSPLNLPRVPADSTQFSICRMNDPVEALRQAIEMTVRLEQGISRVIGSAATQPVRTWIEQISAAAEQHPSEFGKLLTGEIGVWQRPDLASEKPAMCLYLGICDPDAVKAKIATIPGVEIIEADGIYQLAKETSLAWSIQSDAILISNNRNYLQASLSADEPSLTDSSEFSTLMNRLPDEFSMLQYVNYENGIPVQDAGKLPPAFLSLLDLFKGFHQLSVSVAADGMLQSHIAQDYNPDRQLLKAAVEMLFSSEWGNVAQSNEEDPFLLSADEAYKQSVDLLSAGRQIEAEDLVENAVRAYPEDLQLLFAKAVLERSRWDKRAAHYYFKKIRTEFPDTLSAQVAGLTMELDSKNPPADGLEKLIEFSDANPDDIYLLWLSAMQSREQAKKEGVSSESKVKVAALGRKQYEKLLKKFTVGPVLLHQTYANILSEELGDHEAALKHRYIAVSLEAKGWTLQGLANTLTCLKRYDEACAIWARAVQLDPLDSDCWYSGGLCLEKIKRHSEMVVFFRKAAELGNAGAQYALALCYQNGQGIKQDYVEASKWHYKAAEQGADGAQAKLGYYYEKGQGVAKDFQKAVNYYRLAADQGNAIATHNLALCYDAGKGVEKDLSQAASLYKKAVELDSDDEYSLNGYAWFLTTCKNESYRDYPKAVELAERSVALDAQNFNLDTLAVAYDRNGQYAQAVEAQKRLIAFRKKRNPDKPVPKRMQQRLEKFEKKAAEKQ